GQPFGRDLPRDVIIGAVSGRGEYTRLTRVDGVARLLVADPCGVDERLGAVDLQMMFEHTLGGDGSADVAGAHEHDGCHSHSFLLKGCRVSDRRATGAAFLGRSRPSPPATDHDTVGP